jgi:hypothetical protein
MGFVDRAGPRMIVGEDGRAVPLRAEVAAPVSGGDVPAAIRPDTWAKVIAAAQRLGISPEQWVLEAMRASLGD